MITMNETNTMNKNSVLDSKTNFKNELDGDYSSLLNRRSRRRRGIRPAVEVADADVCPVCGSTKISIDYTRSEKSCGVCGVVIEENIVDSTIRGTARDKDGNSYGQNGAPKDITIHDGGISTDFDPNKGNFKNRAQWHRLKKWQGRMRVSSPRERNLSRALGQLALLVSNLSLSRSVKYEAAAIYREALDMDLVRGRSIDKLLVATVYIACRKCKVPRTLDEMSEGTGLDKKTIGKNYRFLNRELGLKLPLISPNDYVPRFASKLGLSPEAEVKSFEIIDLAAESGLTSGKDPASITAASLYWASMLVGERRTQTEIAKTLGVTEVTIRNRFKELSNSLNL